jgi:hypothetical protein
VPLLLVALASALVESRGRYDSGHFDPEYNYLFNALNVAVLEPPGRADHPGTTLHLLGAACIVVRWLANRIVGESTSLREAVLREPERYLDAIQFVLVALIVVSVYAAGRAAARAAGALRVGIALQLGALLFVTPLRALSRVSPEPLLVALVFALLIPLLPLVFASEIERSRGAVAAGSMFGLGVVSKVTFLPLAAALAFLPARRSRARFALAALLATAVASVPIWPRLARVADWHWSLVTHSGVYGQGAIGAPSAHLLRENFERILTDEPLMPVWLIFYLAALLALRFGLRGAADASSRATARALAFGACVISVQAVMAMKHYMGPRYLLPALVATTLPNAALLRFLDLGRLRDGARWSLAIGGGALVAASLAAAAVGLAETVESNRAFRADVHDLAQARQRLGDCLTIGYYRSSAGNYAMHFGSGYAAGTHAAILGRLHPGSLSYQRWSAKFIGFDGSRRDRAVRQMLRRGRCVLLQGSVMAEGELELPPGFALRELVRGRHESLSRLELSALR